MIVAVDDDGCFTERITDFSGRYVKDADKAIIEAVKVLDSLHTHISRVVYLPNPNSTRRKDIAMPFNFEKK